MKRVLFIAYFFPPLANSGTQRPLKFANYLPDFGWEPLVLTVDNPPDRNIDRGLLREMNPALRVTRVQMTGAVLGPAIGWRLRKYFDMPDMYALWRPAAVRAGCRLFRDVGFDAIWATGYPWTSLLVGRDVSRRTGRPFVADFRDPWTQEDVFEVQTMQKARNRHTQLERSVLSQASGIVGLAGMVTDELRSLTPNAAGKHVVTISNGFDRSDFETIEPCHVPRRARVRMVYTGVWKDGYGLGDLYEAIRMARATSAITPQDLEVVAAGFDPGRAEQHGVGEFVTELGRVSHASALGMIHSADVLFLPVAPGKRERMHLPGKLYEYAASGRPILAVADTPSEVSTFFADIGGGVVVPPADVAALTRGLLAFCSNGAIAVAPLRRDRLEDYERRTLTAKLALLLDSVSSPPG